MSEQPSLALRHDLLAVNRTLCHYGVPDQKWGKHNPKRRWQAHAVYAKGRPDPNAKKRTGDDDDKSERVIKLPSHGSFVSVRPLSDSDKKEIEGLKRQYVEALKNGKTKDYNVLHDRLRDTITNAYSLATNVDEEQNALIKVEKRLEDVLNKEDGADRGAESSALVVRRKELTDAIKRKRSMAIAVAYNDAMNDIAKQTGIDKETIEARSFFPEQKRTLLGKVMNAIRTRSVAKYLDADGRLKPDVIAELRKLAFKGRLDKDAKRELENKGIVVTNDGYSIPKGTSIGRVATEDDVLDNRRKYMYVTKGDGGSYRYLGDGKETIYNYTLKRDLKIAPDSFVLDFFINEYKDKPLLAPSLKMRQLVAQSESVKRFLKHYGNTKMDVLYQNAKVFLDSYSEIPVMLANDRVKARFGKKFGEYLADMRWVVNQKVQRDIWRSSDYMSAIEKAARDAGYDGVVDVEDAMMAYELPIIVFDPVDKMKLTGTTKTTDID